MWGTALGVALAVAAASPLRAEDVTRARTLYEAGAVYYERGEFQKALDQFDEAYRLAAKPGLLYNIAQCHDRLGNLDQAIGHLRRFLAQAPADDPEREFAQGWLRALEERREKRDRPPPPPVVKDTVEPASQVTETTPSRDESWRPPAWSPWAALGVAVAAAGAGAFFGARVLDRDVSYDDSGGAATGATVSFAIAGVAGASAVGLWIWRSQEGP
jgi:tetratricopeptide (TPR) repeat protein